MQRITRRDMVKRTVAGGLAGGVYSMVGPTATRAAGPNGEVRLGIVGLGGIDVPGSVGGRGRQLINGLRKVSGAKVAAICDVDQDVLGHQVEKFKQEGQSVKAYADLRKLFADKDIDAVMIATPNHWHALATIWACEAGKDVYVEKPFSHDIWEGKQMMAAARKHNRLVQVGTQSRSSTVMHDAFAALHAGALGKMQHLHAIIYRARAGIGRVDGPTDVPKSVDYNMWSGPVAMEPVMRKHLHYEWHWFWSTGNGEIGNNGPHTIDIARWALGQQQAPPRAMSIGGRFGANDSAETANTQIAIFDYQPVPMICEVRNLRASRDAEKFPNYRGTRSGLIIDCEGGHCVAGRDKTTFYDRDGKSIKEFSTSEDAAVRHLANFVDSVQRRDRDSLNAEALEGHLSAICFHMANVSYRLGSQRAPSEILEMTRANHDLTDAFERCRGYLAKNGVDLDTNRAVAGPWLNFDPKEEHFVGDFAEQANALSRKEYRAPFVVES